MSTTAEKLQKIIDIKNDLKEKINAKGGSITDTTPFAEYPTIADELMGSSGGEGTLDITENGQYDVSSYAEANVNVDTGGEKVRSIKLYLDYTKTCEKMFRNYPNSALPEGMLECDDTSEVENMKSMFENSTIVDISLLNTSKVKTLYYAFYGCKNLQSIQLSDTSNCNDFSGTFNQCKSLETVILNLINATSINGVIGGCNALKNLTLQNIKMTLQIGYASSWGHLLTLDSLLNTIKELINTGSSKTLTIGSANLDKLANVYVKLTGEAEEDETLPKLPFVVCESTDEGAMLITDYVTLKNWSIAA